MSNRTGDPLAVNIIFFKLHKERWPSGYSLKPLADFITQSPSVRSACWQVGGTTYADVLHRAIVQSGGTSGAVCILHNNTLPLLPAFRRADVLSSDPWKRSTLLQQTVCPLVPSLPLITTVLMRHPVERVISKYFFHRATCSNWRRPLISESGSARARSSRRRPRE